MNTLKGLFASIILACTLLLSNCGAYDEGPFISLRFKKARLEGEWKVISINAENVSHSEIYEFDSDNDARYFNESLDAWFSPDKGKWKWEDDKQNIQLTWEKNGSYEIQIKKLTMDELWFDDENNELVKCEKQ